MTSYSPTKKPQFLFSFFVILLLWTNANSQNLSDAGQDDNSSVFIDGLSPVILEQGGLEISNSSFLISYWNKLRLINLNGGVISDTYRLSLFQSRTSINYGFSADGRWDLGAELVYTKRRWDGNSRTSPFKVFSGDDLNKSGISHLGVKFRIQPFVAIPELTVQSTVRIPIANGQQLRRDLGAESLQAGLFTTFYKPLNYVTSILVQGGWNFTFPKTFDETNTKLRPNHNLSAGAYVSVNAWSQRFYVIPGMSYSGNFRKSATSSRILQLSHSILADLVLQFQIGERFSLNIQQSYPLLFESYSPTVQFERRSFSLSSLGLRLKI